MKLTIREKGCFGVGAFSKDIFSVVITSYLMVFYTDVFGLSASLAGMVLMITRLIDALSNPVLGSLMDRTSTRWGRFRPYLFVVPIPFCIFTILTFWTPDLSVGMKFIYALITFNIAGLCFTCIDVAIWGLVPNLTRDGEERSQLIALSRAFSNLAGMVFAPVVIPLVIFFGGGNDAHGWLWLGVVVGILSILFSWMLFFNTREIHRTTAVESPPFAKAIRQVFRNPAVGCVVLAMTTFGLGVGLQNAVGIYYMKYYLRLPDAIPIYIFMSYSCKVIGALIAPLAIARLGNCRSAFATFAIMGGISLCMIFAPIAYPIVYFALAALFALGIGILLVAITGMMAETSDRIEAVSGQRNDGMLFSLNALSMQTGFALSGALAGFILQLSGYVPNQPVQSDSSLAAINFIRCLGPALFCFMVLFAFRLYPAGNGKISPCGDEMPDASSPR
ncbi:MFS transporter [Samsonia erythrinae]|uniref:GPH family glycoside/pentoside/hexuronide:cation symporter n=1 Tax=Samsonia erythrinae TaxID=160434 RepID=A0A4R3VV75_9GAMM|nr:MFS transporter [Samsonia erythrinae]TCV08573.1 GPH family glycoside/pentoside/hexuronide:cation symporter [Samsonia erythrinae]